MSSATGSSEAFRELKVQRISRCEKLRVSLVVPEIFNELEEPVTVLPYDQPGADRGNADKINKELSSYGAEQRLHWAI